MITITNIDRWTKNKKSWWTIYGTHDGTKSLIAKINSKGLAYIVAQKLAEIYDFIEIE